MLVRAKAYRPTLERLRSRFRVILVEPPGVGRASTLPAPWEFSDYARWAGELFDMLDLSAPTVIGHSNSGAAALLLAAQSPRHVGRLVLVGTVGFDPGRTLAGILAGRAIDAGFEWWLSITKAHHVLYNVLVHPRNFFHQVALAVETDLSEVAPRVEMPTLIAWGRRDHTVPQRTVERLARLLPEAEQYMSPTGSHDWIVDHPAEFAKVVTQFASGPGRLQPPPPEPADPLPNELQLRPNSAGL